MHWYLWISLAVWLAMAVPPIWAHFFLRGYKDPYGSTVGCVAEIAALALVWPLGAVALLLGRGALAQPSYTVPLAQLQEMVVPKFPRSVPVQGLFDLTLQVPLLRLLPEVNRLGATMAVDAAGPALRRSHAGLFDVEFALRYEASDRTVRAHQLRFKRLQFLTLQPSVVRLISAYGQALSERTLLEVVVHRLRAQDLALPDAMGLQPGSITVTTEGLTIGFVPKPLS